MLESNGWTSSELFVKCLADLTGILVAMLSKSMAWLSSFHSFFLTGSAFALYDDSSFYLDTGCSSCTYIGGADCKSFPLNLHHNPEIVYKESASYLAVGQKSTDDCYL